MNRLVDQDQMSGRNSLDIVCADIHSGSENSVVAFIVGMVADTVEKSVLEKILVSKS